MRVSSRVVEEQSAWADRHFSQIPHARPRAPEGALEVSREPMGGRWYRWTEAGADPRGRGAPRRTPPPDASRRDPTKNNG